MLPGGGGGGGKLTSQPKSLSASPPHVDDDDPSESVVCVTPMSQDVDGPHEFDELWPFWLTLCVAVQLPEVKHWANARSSWNPPGVLLCWSELWFRLYVSDPFEPWFGSNSIGPYCVCVTLVPVAGF